VDFHVRYPKPNGDLTSEKQPGNVAYGNGITGSILSATTPNFQSHVDYVHVNPLKHGYVKRVADGLIQLFIAMSQKVFIQSIGAVTSIP